MVHTIHLFCAAAGIAILPLAMAGEALSVAALLQPVKQVEEVVSDGRSELEFASVDAKTWQLRGTMQGKRTTVVLRPPSGIWDFSGFSYFRVDMVNSGPGLVWIEGRLDNTNAEDWMNSAPSEAFLMPGERGTLAFCFQRADNLNDAPAVFDGLHGKPNGHRKHWKKFDPAGVRTCRLVISTTSPSIALDEISFSLAQPYGAEANAALLEMPYLDRFGQVRQLDWPGKLKSGEELERRRAAEQRANKGDAGPAAFDRFGGWADGPKLDATGFFRVTDYKGKWWLVDPDGHLFFSHGLNSVDFNAVTPVTGREELFEWLPREGDPLRACLSDAKKELMNFMLANVIRTFGEEWETRARDRVHQRLRRWGLNTLGAWSEPELAGDARTPYTGIIHVAYERSPLGHHVPDPFSDGFKSGLRAALQRFHESRGEDPWCIGLFIDNEIDWDDHVIERALAAGPDLPARQFVMKWLKEKYQSLESFNAAWGSTFDSWEAVKGPPVPERLPETDEFSGIGSTDAAKADKKSLIGLLAEEYYRTCRETLKAVLPNHLYLGSRIHRAPEPVMKAAARHVDVLSQNRYGYTAGSRDLPEGVDVPLMNTEFHFGAPDRGVPGVGMVPVGDQRQRSRAYVAYVVSALQSRNVVGTHWFAFSDQCAAGRPGGENHQIGFVDITDAPYPEITEACRAMADRMYEIRGGDGGDMLSILQSLWDGKGPQTNTPEN